ncbi:MAG: hypothetical protein RLZZ143_3593, partial [Cyanobacteriota bacterium]
KYLVDERYPDAVSIGIFSSSALT